MLGAVVFPYALAVVPVPGAHAQTEYLPANQDFIGKWKLAGSAIRPPRDLAGTATQEQEAAATEFQQTVTAFYGAFDYLEITADGRYNFHQPGDPASSPCVWCGTWSFTNDSLWLALDTAPRLDIYAKGGDMQMTYTAEQEGSSRYKWLVFSWTKSE
ncbi:hypothetical protein [Rhizobium sp. PL01]|uniref:hypothetical protein n=1 Tax=Rhizobium sp. PL01 TaxID=3085631 RepID=UPI002980BDCC|nr:hypothetical protein [Rhizobium sp. PL01]MDW5317176.1 hypothetical protein [Rhizobium sp. PL01]